MPEFDEVKTQLVEHARKLGWREAIARVPDSGYLTDKRRGIFVDLLPIHQVDVLEIGPGFGQFTDRIAKAARSVDALEVDPDQADFIREKIRQESLANVRVTTGGGDCKLPYE